MDDTDDAAPTASGKPGPADLPAAGFRPAGADETVRANRRWWDESASSYQVEHADDLAGFVWCPEGLREEDVGLLGDVRGLRVLEVGAGGAQCSRWLADRGALPVATDLSVRMLRSIDGAPIPRLQCDARALPLADRSVDLAFTAYGAVPFVADPERIYAEVARVLRPGGRWVFAITHPIRWAFPDDPGPRGLRATRSYFDTTPYVETGADGVVSYAEHHKTLGQQVRALAATGFTLLDVVEPTWPPHLLRAWGGWSPRRGAIIPGTAIFVTELSS